jgi:hypothetical protein
MGKRVKEGDIIEIPTAKGLAYAQYALKNREWGALLRVLPGFHQTRPADFAPLVAQPERFVTFFPLQAAVSRKIFAVVAHADVPARAQVFPLFRAAGFIDRDGKVQDWWLWDGEREWRVGQLTDELRRLPLRSIFNDTLLITRIEEGWTPETDPRSNVTT